MKTRALFIILTSVCLLALMANCGQKKQKAATETTAAAEITDLQNLQAEDGDGETNTDALGKPLGVKSGIIEYTYSGDKTGKSTQYFDDYGMKSAVYAEIVQQGEPSKGWSLTIGEDQYMWDPGKPGEGMKAKNPMAAMMTGKSAEEMETLTASMYEQMGMAKSGTEMFQGKACTVYKGDMGKVLIWKGLLMMMEIRMGDVVSRQEVTSIKTNTPVDTKYFKIPDNITFSELPGF
ncbi:MAG: hypothetical protein GXY59_11160 [Bacteroidales bacterium]|nr:hypothetical protein [Bacteroidales bacterium]